MAITVAKEVEERWIGSIQRYFRERLDEEIGDLKASLLLEFCLREIAPTIYNGAISDAQAYMQERVADIEGSLYEKEFAYWRDE